jgi:uncharacterized membrane protein
MEESRRKGTTLGVDENVGGLLCYILGWITGILFLILEKENKFVRFHAAQSLATFLPLFVILAIVGMIPLIGWLLTGPVLILTLILWLLLMFKALKGERYHLPIVGDFAEEVANK